ncbi:MAG TPA: DUF3276 family protein [Edaphocola sp.]|nr:DUF3276 family protein [Edaphocola sp.]
MAYDNNRNFDERHNPESIYSKRIKAGKRRTYFFDVRETRGNDYFITITESKKRFNDDGYDRHKMFIYKEDFNKFITALTETADYVKTELMPDFDFDAFNHDYQEDGEYESSNDKETTPSLEASAPVADNSGSESDSVDSWKI